MWRSTTRCGGGGGRGQLRPAAADHCRRQCPRVIALTPSPPPLPCCPLPQSLAQNIAEAYYRLEPFLRAAVRGFVRQHLDTFAENEDGSDKQFWISFYGLPDNDKLRALRSARIGKLSQFVGTVTRTTDVRPELFTGTFRCMECLTGARSGGVVGCAGWVGVLLRLQGGWRLPHTALRRQRLEARMACPFPPAPAANQLSRAPALLRLAVVKDVEQQFKYTQPAICPNPTCGNKCAGLPLGCPSADLGRALHRLSRYA